MDDRSEFHREKVAEFKALVGIAGLAGLDATDGVLADWRQLTPLLSGDLPGLRLVGHDASPLKSGIGKANWNWMRREDGISVEIYVCGTGPAGARARLIEKATNTTTVKSHMALAHEKVGELAVEHESHEGDDILWIFRNVCVSIYKFGGGPKVSAVARRIQ